MGRGLASFQARMRAVPKAARAAVKPALLSAGHDVGDTIETLAPEDTGDLKGSVAVTGPGETTPPYSQPGGSMTVPEHMVAVTVGNSDVRYPHLVEYGTADAPAQPFFWPGFRLSRKKAQAKIKRAIGKAIREARS
ncbi:HK97-gp10 family putative phage morphogenesis protein [uncultured Jannaschia sp.]|uniref:HK97-gp10 family putative phage morphogenesis protein n=1 Tax=uncultured Jannaschia sp. TaxID=293347 RepID=UPI00262A7E39|nr:HK97-gp10 family putative phage morphogenesis protein [uncultured Jannaschia sp.]